MTKPLQFDDLIISDNRQRREFDPEHLTDLANSILSLGLLHPVVVRETPTGLVLVAGERRLRAMQDLWMMGDSVKHNGKEYPPYEVPYVTLGQLSHLEAEEAELDENLKRRDLTWQERAEALARLHRLRTAQAAELGETRSIAETLKEVETTDYSTDRQAILLADHLSNPDVSKAKNVKEAFKALKRSEDRTKSIALAEAVGRDYNSSVHKLHHVDCIDWLKVCPANSFDVILTDPPYGMGADAFGDGAGKLAGTDHRYSDDANSWLKLMTSFAPLAFSVAKPQAHAYVFCDFDKFHTLKSIMESAGWYVFRTPLVVYKLGSGRVPLPEQGPRRQYELVLYAIKGWKPVRGIFSDVIPCRLEENLAHGANKPIELFVDLLKRSVSPGDSVLDAFTGTGTIFPAAHECKVYATGLELNSEYYGIAVQRLNQLDDEPSMV